MSTARLPALPLAKLFGSSVVDQALLSAANFAAGLSLIRYASEVQYGYYILAFNTMMLLTTLQGTFIGTPLVIRLPGLSEVERRQWLGSLWRDQRRLGIAAGLLALLVAGGLWAWGRLEQPILLFVAIPFVLAALYREYFRGVLMMYHRPHAVLLADTCYVAVLLAGCWLAIHSPFAAAIVLVASTVGAILSGRGLGAHLGDEIDWSSRGGRLYEIARVGFWAASGGVIYWCFNQGYNMVAAATLDLAAVAALGASRLIMMPVNLLSAGVQRQLTPLASSWLYEHGARRTLRRLLAFSAGIGALTVVYAGLAWLMRDWIFLSLMHKDFPQRDMLLLLWSVLFLLMVMREPPTLVVVLRQRFRLLTMTTLVCAVLSLACSYLGMLRLGPMGAVIGILVGEVGCCVAVGVLAWREVRADARANAGADVREGGGR
ncbi:capsular biosynthesis protein [Cupriavidus sp. USMAA2-4]|uniref:lipopolysaccharide biosynthesis protein n=1 Tax=unclassified Cupriavidus TaxID=2640874 RepID=UPI0008A6EAFE|nr:MULTISPECIES: capsular biosynthesis protein [unclassified Cupriavidus]AOY91514.1 capsular biosynthesis protein [Cupriavidus sp. USMAA2-4]AOY98940.1 capsular biosynthesis protein [Cupriavidus sp. USMAHM13]